MPRTTRIPLPARQVRTMFLGWALVPLVLAATACGDGETPSAKRTTIGASTNTSELAADTPAIDPAAASAERERAARREIIASATAEDAEAAYRDGRYEEAQEIFEALASARPEAAWNHYMLGLAAWKAGDLGRAEQAFERALALDPSHVKSWLNSARVLLDAGRAHEALERAQIALTHDSTSAAAGEALRLVGRAEHRLGNAHAAIDAYRRALVVNDRDVWAMNNLGLLHLERGEAEAALPPLARAVQLRSTAPVFQNNLGIALERTGHLPAAARAYEAALRADSGYTKARTSLERVTALVDSTTPDTVDLAEQAETFRLLVRMWQEGTAENAEAKPNLRDEGQDQGQVEDTMPSDTVAADSIEG